MSDVSIYKKLFEEVYLYSFCLQLWSALCKTLAEKAAWALATDRGLDLIVMNPATVVGPMLGMDMNNNVQNLLDKSGVFALAYILA